MPRIELTASDGHALSAYRATPDGECRGAIVVAQEIFGVNHHIRAVVDRFAGEGYDTVAPALFDRTERDVELDYTDDAFTRGRALAASLSPDGMMADMAAARDAVAASGKVAVVGYCFGGAVVWVAAARLTDIACAVSYYGSRIPTYIDDAPKVPTMLHVGRQDPSFPMDAVEAIGKRYPEVVIHAYDAGHGFNCDARSVYDADAAASALERTLAMFADCLG